MAARRSTATASPERAPGLVAARHRGFQWWLRRRAVARAARRSPPTSACRPALRSRRSSAGGGSPSRPGLVFVMDPLHRQAIVQGLFGTIFFIVLIFWPAGTFDYWQGWLFLATFAASTVAFTVYLALYDRPLLERRMKAGPQYEREWS